MRRLAITLTTATFAFTALSAAGCGGDGWLSGSQCKLIDCSYDELVCHLYQDQQAYKLFYNRTLKEGGTEYTAILNIDITDLDQLDGLVIEDEMEFKERVGIYRPSGEQWPDVNSGKLTLKKGGREYGDNLAGKVNFRFTNGYLLTAKFDCRLEDPLAEE
jgi:hypothetical protein